MGSGQGSWLGLIIGNTRWHWGAFAGDRWLGGWHTRSLTEAEVRSLLSNSLTAALLDLDPSLILPEFSIAQPELWAASVVRAPLGWLADYPTLHTVTLAAVPLGHTYPTLGVDRALALVGAGDMYGWPVLVIDCGTAITYTAGVDRRLVGGAILPGLRSQLRALHTDTDQLPPIDLPASLPPRWATDTAGAIASGIVHTQLAGMADFIAAWEADQAAGAVVMTGGDSTLLSPWLKQKAPGLGQRLRLDPDLGFWGLRVVRRAGL
jgi:type III pantothenate kinase